MNKVDALQACESTSLDCTSKDEVGNYKEGIFVEKEDLIMKKDMKNRKIMKEKHMKINKKYSTL